jgi:hypothetical protein
MIRLKFKDGRTRDFRDVSIQRKDQDRVIALFNRKYVIIAQFQAEDVSELLEIPDGAMRSKISSTISSLETSRGAE